MPGLPKWFVITIEITGIILTLVLAFSAVVQTRYLIKANDIQDRLVQIEETHVYPEIMKVVSISPTIRGKVNESITIQFEMAYDGERVPKYYVRWYAKGKTGGSGNINYETDDEQILKIMHREKNSVIEEFDFSFEKKGTYIVAANILYSYEDLKTNDPDKTELDVLIDTATPLIQEFDVIIE